MNELPDTVALMAFLVGVGSLLTLRTLFMRIEQLSP